MFKYEIYDLFESAPNWLRLSIVLSMVYLTYSFWSLLVRFNRERRLASRILEERRKAGIPDTDTRPFRIAKAAVEKKRNESADEHVHKSRVTFSSDLLDDFHPKETAPGPSQNVAFEASNASTTSKPRRRPSSTYETRSKSLRELPFTRMSPTSSTGPATTTTLPSEGQHKLAHSLRSKNKRTASAYAPSEASPGGSPETLTHTHTRTTKKVKTKPTIKSPNKRGLPTQTELNRKKTKLSVPGDLSIQDEQMEHGSDSQGEEVESVMIEKGKKRILSDAVSETDLQGDELKNKRGKSIKQTEEDQVQDERNDEDHSSQLGEDQEIDKDVFMITDDGQKKKLIKIRQVLDIGDRTDQTSDEDTIERRWVTRTEFESLKQAGQLLISDEIWDDRSTTPSEAMNMSMEFIPSSNSNASLIPRPDAEIEDGPIWSIEGKPSSRTMSTENSVAIKLRPPGSRPRNSLGRMRLSLPPDPTSPAPRSRSKMGSLIHDDRYINDKPFVEKQVAIISPTTETSSQPNAKKDVSRTSTQPNTNTDVSRTSTQPLSILPPATQLPIESSLQNQSSSASLQAPMIPVASSATANTSGQQLFGGPTRIGNVDLPVSAPKAAPDFSFGSTSSSTQKSTSSASQPSVAGTNNLAFKVLPTSTSPSPFRFTSTTANTGSGGFSFGSNNLSTAPKESASNATPITSTPLFGATSTSKSGDALSTTSTGAPGVPSFSFNSSPLPAPQKEATIVSSAFNLNGSTPKKTSLTTENSIAQPPKANPSTTSSFPAFGGTLGTTFNPTFAPNTGINKSPSIFGNPVTQNQSSKPFQSTNTTNTTTTSAFGATSGATTFSFGAPTSPMVSSTTKQTSITFNAPSSITSSTNPGFNFGSQTSKTNQPKQDEIDTTTSLSNSTGTENRSTRKLANPRTSRITVGPTRVLAKAMSSVEKQAVTNSTKLNEGAASGNQNASSQSTTLELNEMNSGPESQTTSNVKSVTEVGSTTDDSSISTTNLGTGNEMKLGQANSIVPLPTSTGQVRSSTTFAFGVTQPTTSEVDQSKSTLFGKSSLDTSTFVPPAVSSITPFPFGGSKNTSTQVTPIPMNEKAERVFSIGSSDSSVKNSNTCNFSSNNNNNNTIVVPDTSSKSFGFNISTVPSSFEFASNSYKSNTTLGSGSSNDPNKGIFGNNSNSLSGKQPIMNNSSTFNFGINTESNSQSTTTTTTTTTDKKTPLFSITVEPPPKENDNDNEIRK